MTDDRRGRRSGAEGEEPRGSDSVEPHGSDGVEPHGSDRAEPQRPEELAADFLALRAEMEDSGRIPAFHEVMARAREEADGEGAGGEADSDIAAAKGRRRKGESSVGADRRVGSRIRWIPLAAAAAAVGLLLVGLPGDGDEQQFERLVASYSESAGAWRSPTASLMDIPGVDLGAVPSFGSRVGTLEGEQAQPVEGRDS